MMQDNNDPLGILGEKKPSNNGNDPLGILKKKETTESPSVQKQESTSSVTPPKGPQKPSVSSVSKKDDGLYKFPGNEKATYKKQGNEWYVDPSGSGNFTKLYKGDVEERVKLLESKAVPYSGKKEENGIFSGVPGKGETEYVLDTSGENPVWAERRLSRMPDGTVIKVINNQTGKSEPKYHTVPITDPTRVQYLNKYFKQNASTSRDEKIFTGLPNKEKNEYKIEDGVWLRRQPGQDDWTKIYDETAVSYLNKNFNQNVKVSPAASKYAKFTEDVDQVELKNLDNRLGSIDKSLVGKEEDVIVDLRSRFPEFKFEKAGLMTDEVTVIAPNKEVKTFPFDNFSDKADVAVANEMKAWMRRNSNLKGIDNIKESEKILAEKENQLKNAKLPTYNPQIKLGEGYGLGPEMNAQIAEKAPEKKVNLMVAEQEVRDARKQYASTVAGAFKDIRDRQSVAARSGSSLSEEQVAAELAQLPKDYTAVKRANEYTNDVKESVKMYADRVSSLNKYAEDIYAKVNSGEISREQFELDYKPLIDKSREAIAQEGESINSQVKNLNYIDAAINESVGEQYVINEAKGSFGGGIAYKFVKGMTYIPRLISGGEIDKIGQDELARMIVGSGTTEEYMESRERSDFSKAMFSLAESMGALASGAALGGGPATYAAFYAQSYYEMKDELDQVKGISDTEKVLMSSVYGAVSSVLEKFGIDFAMQKTGFGKNITNSIVKSVLMDMPKNAPKEFIEASIRNNISSTLLKAGIRTAGAGIVEGATETAQALSQVGIQEVYDIAKGTEYFNNKSGWEILSDAAYEGYLGMLGGHVMGVVSNSKQVATEGIQKSMNKEQMEVLFNSAKMDGIPEALLTNLKSSIISGKISKQEAQEIYNSYGEVKSKIQSIPEEYSVESKSVALDLMLEKDRINKQIAGKDANLVKPQMDRIAEIDNQLKTIGENAVKESTKPVQEVTAEGGGIQREGTQERQPEVREGERPVGETAQPETDFGNRPIEGRGAQEARVTRDVVNRPATLSEFGGRQLDTPLNGDVYVDGQQVVFEDRATGRVYDLGNVDQVMDTQISGLSVEQERVSITPEGKVSIDNSNWNIQSELPTQGIEYNPAGEVTRVSLKDDAGNTRMFEGQDAVDIAYQIELQKYQSPEQQQFINDLLEQDEEFQTATENIKPAEVTAVVQEEATPDIVQAEPTAVEEAVVEQPVAEEAVVAEEVERLGKLLEGTDEQIEEEVGKLKISKDNNKVAQSIANAAKSIAKILPDVKFVVHDTDASYRKATKEQGRSQSSAGEYNPNTRTIHINGTKANNRTAPHEILHAVILNGVKNDAEAARLTKTMIDAVRKSLVNVQGAGEIISYLNDFASNYEENIQNEEKLAELFGILSDNYATLPTPTQSLIRRFLDRIAKMFGLKPLTDREVIDFMNVVSQKVARGEEITVKDIKLFGPKEQGDGGEVGTFSIPRQQRQAKIIKAPSVKNDERSFIRNIVEDIDVREFNGKPFITNMYDYTNAGETNLGNGLTINLFGGKGYVPYMMELKGNNIGQVSNLAAFNTKAQAETFIRNSINGNANLFAPHSGTLDQSWQFQQHMFAELVDLILKNNILSNSELIQLFNNTIKSNEKTIKAFNAFKNKYGEDINNFDSFESNPNEIVRLLDIENNFSPDLRKALNNAIPANKKFKEALGINNKDQFYKKIMDPLNDGVEGGEIMSIVQFDPNTFEIVQTKPGDIDHHPSFGWTLLAKIDGVYQPTEFYKSYDVTDTYTKYNKDKTEVSRKTEEEKFAQKNVMSSAGAIPKIAELKSIRKQIDNSFEAREQKPKGITAIINTARQNGFSDAAIEQYLLGQGYSQQEISNAMTSRPASGTTVKDVFKKSKEELEAKYKKPSIFKRFMEGIKSFRKAMFDRQTDLKRGLRGIKNKEAKQAHAKLVDKAGASGFAGLRFKILDKKIYRGKFNRMLPKQDLEALDEIIYSRRMISINENRAKLREKAYDGLTEESKKDLDNIVKYKESKNTNELNKIKDRVGEKAYKDLLNRSEIYKEPYTGKDGFNESDAQRDLEDKRSELGEKKFNDLNRRADIYFDAFSENLKILKDSGRINEETYNNLKDVEYSPIKTIKYIIDDNKDLSDIDREAARIGITKDDIMSLTNKNENGIITDSRWLLMMNLNTVSNRAFENQMINEMVDAIEKATPEEKSTLSEYFILDNPVVGEFKDGRPKRKYDSETMPDGYRKVHYFKNGVDNYIIAREDIARQILDVKETKVVPAIEQFNEDVPILGWLIKNLALTPSRMLRFFATGGNPFFILRNVPMDWGNAVFFTDVYSHKWYEYFKLISGVKAAVGFTKNFTKKMFNDLKRTILNGEIDKVYMEYAAHGGLMESMSQEGLRALKELKPKGRIASKIPNAKLRSAFEFTVNAPYRILSAYGTALSYLGETSEIAMRLAVYEKMKKNLIDDYKKENNGENPTEKDLDDIMWEASREARELIDFNQGGTWAKEMDVFMPYFNAGMQGLRKPLDYAEQKPAQFASSMFQLSVMGAILAGTSIATALAAFDDEDDEEERKKKVKFALDSISVHEKANYHIIFTGKKDKNGELQYIRIKKLPVASIITTAAENLMYSTQLGYDNKKVLGKTLKASTPVWPTEIPGRNPMIAAIVAYYGYDLFTEEQVFRAPKNKKILPIAEGLEDDRVEAIYKSLAPSLGLSPARSKAFVEKIITNESTNPTINIIYAAANGIFDRSSPFGENFTTMSDELLKHAERQSVRYTNKDIVRYSLQDEFEKKEMKRETEIYLKEQKVYNQIKKVYDEGGSLTVGELENIVEKNFDKARQLTELKKYYAYARNMNIDKSMLDIIYEENPEVQSMRIYERYGNVIDKEEVKELGQIIGNTGKRISPKTWYYYEKEFKGKIQ